MLYLIRHGETDWNREHKIQGVTDIPLNEKGHEQALLLAQKLRNIPFDRIYSSHLLRAYSTAQNIASLNGTVNTVLSDERLRERTFGAYEGLTLREIVTELEQKYNCLLPNFDPSFDWFGDTEVERIEAVAARLMLFLDDVSRESSLPICAVTHGGVMKVLMDTVLGIPYTAPRRYAIPNCAVMTLKKKKEVWFLHSFSGIDDFGGQI